MHYLKLAVLREILFDFEKVAFPEFKNLGCSMAEVEELFGTGIAHDYADWLDDRKAQ